MKNTPTIRFNQQLRLAFSDVDETIAEVYTVADPAMVDELNSLLAEGVKLFMVTGGSLMRVRRDITDQIDPALRQNILISHCSGVEVWGFTSTGSLRDDPFYSVYNETFTDDMKAAWRRVVVQLVEEFNLRTHPAQSKKDFWENIGREMLDIMLDDRGPQITMEFVNAVDLSDDAVAALNLDVPLTHGKRDLRTVVKNRAEELFAEAQLPITPRFGGNFALDFAVEGVSKTTSIQTVLNNPEVLETIGLAVADVQNPNELEVWGDKFGHNGGTDRQMSEALPPEVRSIDFRQEDPAELPQEYNIVLWDGEQHLHHGLLEYLQSRHS